MSDQTIFALATGAGPAGIAVFRISGPGAGTALQALAGGRLPSPRAAARRRLRLPDDDVPLDDALVLWFPAPASFTGEDVAELHVHGGRAVIEAVAAALGGLPGLRPAEAGEFTRRAYENGKLDLAQAEALADLVAAESEAQRLQALDQLGGGLSVRFEDWRAQLIALLAHVEAAIDFADEEIPDDLLIPINHKILGIKIELTLYLEDRHQGERLRQGLQVTILGAPNAGKSSLLNALARREAAIVSETEGTTRDVIEVHIDLGGLPVILADTAGLRTTDDAIEAEGVRRAESRAREAELRLCIFDATRWPDLDGPTRAQLGLGAICVLNKSDLVEVGTVDESLIVSNSQEKISTCLISAKTGAGLDHLLALVEQVLKERFETGRAAPLTRARHRRALEDAVSALDRAVGGALELAPEV
ncbi:MAG: tRNA modification GTPase, partial [Alphaproteobacteria bacterium]